MVLRFQGHAGAFQQFLKTGMNQDQVTGGLGLYTEKDVEEFIKVYFPKFKLILLSERYGGRCMLYVLLIGDWCQV